MNVSTQLPEIIDGNLSGVPVGEIIHVRTANFNCKCGQHYDHLFLTIKATGHFQVINGVYHQKWLYVGKTGCGCDNCVWLPDAPLPPKSFN
jgi:hypothetical protein